MWGHWRKELKNAGVSERREEMKCGLRKELKNTEMRGVSEREELMAYWAIERATGLPDYNNRPSAFNLFKTEITAGEGKGKAESFF